MTALAYYSLGVTILLAEYLSESSKLIRGMFTDTYNALAYSEVVSWPSSTFVATWNGYPELLNQAQWQKTLNDSVPSHMAAITVQAILIFTIIKVWGMASGLRRSKVPRAGGERYEQPPSTG